MTNHDEKLKNITNTISSYLTFAYNNQAKYDYATRLAFFNNLDKYLPILHQSVDDQVKLENLENRLREDDYNDAQIIIIFSHCIKEIDENQDVPSEKIAWLKTYFASRIDFINRHLTEFNDNDQINYLLSGKANKESDLTYISAKIEMLMSLIERLEDRDLTNYYKDAKKYSSNFLDSFAKATVIDPILYSTYLEKTTATFATLVNDKPELSGTHDKLVCMNKAYNYVERFKETLPKIAENQKAWCEVIFLQILPKLAEFQKNCPALSNTTQIDHLLHPMYNSLNEDFKQSFNIFQDSCSNEIIQIQALGEVEAI
jgi:hypothetical protein